MDSAAQFGPLSLKSSVLRLRHEDEHTLGVALLRGVYDTLKRTFAPAPQRIVKLLDDSSWSTRSLDGDPYGIYMKQPVPVSVCTFTRQALDLVGGIEGRHLGDPGACPVRADGTAALLRELKPMSTTVRTYEFSTALIDTIHVRISLLSEKLIEHGFTPNYRTVLETNVHDARFTCCFTERLSVLTIMLCNPKMPTAVLYEADLLTRLVRATDSVCPHFR